MQIFINKNSYQLTKREVEVLKHLQAGQTNKEIAASLFISIETVKKHLKNIYTKLKVRNRTEASGLIYQHNMDTHIIRHPILMQS